jgi:hypothetical protein
MYVVEIHVCVLVLGLACVNIWELHISCISHYVSNFWMKC